MLDARLYLLQRLTALVMAPLVLVHLAVILVAIRGGLSTAEILSRTQGNLSWAAFYGGFVVAVSIHAAIGLRVIAAEWLGLRGRGLAALGWVVFAGLMATGLRAVWAVTFGGAP